MDRTTFEAELTRDGYTVVSVSMRPNAVNSEHAHPFDARLLVAEGAMTIVREGDATRTYNTGETFEMPVGTKHSETAGNAGAVYVAGRRVPTKEMAQ
jgi:quercetin dioxygenase-like cupin family protein